MQTYDLVTKKARFSGHANAVNSTSYNQDSIEDSLNTLDELGADPKKVNLGIPFYGRGFKVIGACDQANDVKCRVDPLTEADITDKELNYENIKKKIIANNLEKFDGKAKASYAFEGDNFYSFPSKQNIAEVLKIMKKAGLKGVFVWELLQDSADNELLKAVNEREY